VPGFDESFPGTAGGRGQVNERVPRSDGIPGFRCCPALTVVGVPDVHPVCDTGARIMSGGQIISNRAPSPGFPVSLMVIPVIERISRARNRPRPVVFAVGIGEYLLLLIDRNTHTVVLAEDDT